MKTEGMNEKLLLRLSKLTEFQNTDTNIKYQQQKLNQDINDFMVKELGMEGNYTIIDIAKKLLETSFEPSRIITP